MIQNIYCVRDVVGDRCINVVVARNDGMCIRNNLHAAAQIIPLQDVMFYQVASFDDESMVVTPCPPRQVSKDAYKFPEQVSTASADSSNFDKAVASISNSNNGNK